MTKTGEAFLRNDKKSDHNYRILLAGIGNIFLSDDAFGVEVIKLLRSTEEFSKGIEIIDFGIASVDLVYELMNGYDALIIVDAVRMDLPEGKRSGEVIVFEPEIDSFDAKSDSIQSGHGIDPNAVLKLAKSHDVLPKKVIIVGCQPIKLEEGIGLSDEMNQSVHIASELVKSLTGQIRNSSDQLERRREHSPNVPCPS